MGILKSNRPETQFDEPPKMHPIKIATFAIIGLAVLVFFVKDGLISPIWFIACIGLILALGFILFDQYRRQQERLHPSRLEKTSSHNHNRPMIGYILMALETAFAIALVVVGIPAIPALIIGVTASFVTFRMTSSA